VTFPGETTTAYVHNGLMKRRLRAVDPAGANVFTWWRYDASWNALAEYAGSGGSGTVLGARRYCTQTRTVRRGWASNS
jgi:hypothetical protein